MTEAKHGGMCLSFQLFRHLKLEGFEFKAYLGYIVVTNEALSLESTQKAGAQLKNLPSVCKRGGKEAGDSRAGRGGRVRGKRTGGLRGRDGEEKGKMEEEEEKENAEEGVEATEEEESR